jgi:predicted nucleotidyltransferase
MYPLIQQHRRDLEALCRRYHVKRLELFGSAVTGEFKPDSSDLDFLVEFAPEHVDSAFDDYFGLLEDLGKLFGRRVDLVSAKSMKNRYFIEEVNKSRQPLYAA